MRIQVERSRPEAWALRKQRIKRSWTKPLWASEWFLEWGAYLLSNWSLLEVLDYLRSLSVLVVVIFYFSESGDRLRQKHNQAWLVIDISQGKGGSGGRIEALQQLNADEVPLIGVDVSGAFLRGIQLPHSHLARSNLNAADVRNGKFDFADLSDSELHYTNFRRASLKGANFQRSNLSDADFWGADLSGADLSGVNLDGADLGECDIRNIKWRNIRNLKRVNISGIKNPPEGFVAWVLQHGGIQIESNDRPA
jgi:hypothetical protein